MWARISEIVLGLWLVASYFIFSVRGVESLVCAGLIFLLSLLSFLPSLNKMHLLEVVPAGILLYTAYSYPTPWLPFALQNEILVALCLLMFCIIPSHASDHPRPWKAFLKTFDSKEK